MGEVTTAEASPGEQQGCHKRSLQEFCLGGNAPWSTSSWNNKVKREPLGSGLLPTLPEAPAGIQRCHCLVFRSGGAHHT